MSIPSPHSTEHCSRLRTALLHLHRTLIELERRVYEKVHGRQGAGDFLQLVAHGESMRWLDPLTRLIVMLDEALDPAGDASATPTVVEARVRELLSLEREQPGEFTARYLQHFDSSPDLAVEHAATLRALSPGAKP